MEHKISTAERAYIALLLLPNDGLRARLQPELAALRDVIAEKRGEDSEVIQSLYEAKAASLAMGAFYPDAVYMPSELTDEQADAAMRATAVWLDIKGSQLTVNREKTKMRYRALVKFIEAQR